MVITLEDIKKLPPKERLEALKKFEAEQKALKENVKRVEEEAEKVLNDSLNEIEEEEEEEETLREKREKKGEESLEDIAEEAEDKAPLATTHEYRVGKPYQRQGEEAYTLTSTKSVGEIYTNMKRFDEQIRENGYLPPDQRSEARENMRELELKTREYLRVHQDTVHLKTAAEEIMSRINKEVYK